ncbi:uncharacterized protein [Lepeophtheirus salmonis]|uniref:uncharacterized protein isoform X2 n=1 Tax=Lepeophtheirus salmonis TaxID=72036 RepID=UPI003AF3ED6C
MTNAALVFTLCILSILGGVIICGIYIAVRECKKYRVRLGEDNRDATVQTGNLILALATSSVFSNDLEGGGGGQGSTERQKVRDNEIRSSDFNNTTSDHHTSDYKSSIQHLSVEAQRSTQSGSPAPSPYHRQLRKLSNCDVEEEEVYSEESDEDSRDEEDAAVV